MNDDEMKPPDSSSEADTDAYYETVASQEEIYLEETEEELRATLISEDSLAYMQRETACLDCCLLAENLDDELRHAAEELITGDGDEPPLSEDAVVEMIRVSRLYRSPLL